MVVIAARHYQEDNNMAWSSYNVSPTCLSTGWSLDKTPCSSMERALKVIDKKCAERALLKNREKLVDIAYQVIRNGEYVDLPEGQEYISINRDWTGEKHYYPYPD